ncbi:MAG: right-handed parallel beta-helix repeat-containing protein [Bacteroidota bacterium]
MKTRKLLFVIIAVASFNSYAQTSIPGGNVSGLWTLAGSPYNIQGSIQILDGTTLAIEPGVTVNFQVVGRLIVHGRLLASGTPTDSITFTAFNTTNGWRGIRFDNTAITNDSSIIEYSKLLYSQASGTSPYDEGGALYFNNFSKIRIANCRIAYCSANYGGGAIACIGSNLIICNNNINNNYCNYYYGGGIWIQSGSPIISGNIITKNYSNAYGGGILTSGTPTINNNIISYNSSSADGGGIHSSGSSVIINNTITYNNGSGCCYSGSGGGGIRLSGNGAIVSNNIISNNTNSAYGGGGIYVTASFSTISNNIISNNTCNQYGGGGIWLEGGNNTLNNNIITNNMAGSNGGGGIYCRSGSQTITNNTITNNSATNGGALYCEQGATPTFINCILWGNTASTSGTQVFLNDEASDPDFNYCNVQGGSAAFELNGNFYTGTYQNNINTDPLFVSPSGGSGTGFNGVGADWSLQSNSPCINSGDPNGTYPAIDKAGNARVTVCRIDMGAYEYQYGLPFTATISQTQQILCYGDSTASATIIVAGGTPTYTYLWNNGQTNATATGLGSGTYTVTVTETSFACSITKTITINQPVAALSLTPSTTNPICTNNNGSATITASGGTSPYTYLWSTNNNNTSNTISELLAGTFSVTVTDNNGCSILDSVTLVTQFPSLSIVSSVTNASCYNNDGNTSVTSSGGTAPYSYLWSNNSINQNLSNIGSGTYSVTATDINGCAVLETLIIDNSIAPISIPICMVTVDSSSTKNLIVWEKPTDAPIESFKIYREIASVYTLVGIVPYDELSEFTDNTSGTNPNITSYKYKLLVLDTCGNESLLSAEHKTVHLQISAAIPQGVNLSWNDYIGFTFSQYRILRDDLGNGNWQAIDSVSFGTTTYTSTDVLPNAQYIIEATRPTACVSTRQSGTARNSSKSNTASQTTGELVNDLIISPNPSKGKFIIELSNPGGANNNIYIVKIYNVLGEQIYLSELNQLTRNEIDLSIVPEGIYFVNVYIDNKIYTRKIVKQ